MKYIKQFFGWSINERYRIITTFTISCILYGFQDGIWGMDFTAWIYSLLLLFPFFYFLFQLKFPRFFILVLFSMQCVWFFLTKNFPIEWIILTVVLYTFLYAVNLYFYPFNAKMKKTHHMTAWLKVIFLVQAFIYLYEPMRLTWYIEGVVLIRFYAFLCMFLFVYAGFVFWVNDWKTFRMLRQ